ncbi:MAG: hypothetical protein R2751_16335 [Bacteroidales bacterium]
MSTYPGTRPRVALAYLLLVSASLALLAGCSGHTTSLNKLLSAQEEIAGTPAYRHSSYITAGDRVYSVGAQDGGFPETGWHIAGEMGGVWDHPIKLLDGFAAGIVSGRSQVPLAAADSFLNAPFGNRLVYTLADPELTVRQAQFVPDGKEGLVIEYEIENRSGRPFEGGFVFSAFVDLRPTWLSERTGTVDGEDSLWFDKGRGLLLARDGNNEWHAAVGCSAMPNGAQLLPTPYQGMGRGGEMTFPLRIPAGKTRILRVCLAGSAVSQEEAVRTLDELKANAIRLYQEKKERYAGLEESGRLTTPDAHFNQVYRWIKYNADWFVRTVPAFGTGIAAGYPDYPWWFGCDSEYALQGYLATGRFELTEATIRLLAGLSEKTNGNGRIVHEVSTNGEVYNPGNVNETPQFISLLWTAYEWTGNRQLLSDHFDLVTRGLAWLEEQDRDGNGFPEGSGMMEIHGLESEMIDVASYSQRAYADAARIADELDDPERAEAYREKARQLKERINADFWSEDFHAYADFIGTDAQALRLLDDAIVRADTLKKPWAVEELKQTRRFLANHPSSRPRPFVLHHNWVVNTPMETGIADPDKANRALESARKFTNPFGVFVTGIDRDETAGQDEGSFRGSRQFSYTGAVMTLPTGVLAVAENNYGNPDGALDMMRRMGRSFSFALPGSIYEVSPDYGMFAQAWNIYGYAVPVVQQFFGIRPEAARRKVTIRPRMPSDWGEAGLENVRVGSNRISLRYRRTGTGYALTVSSRESGWDLDLIPAEGTRFDRKEVASQDDRKGPGDRTEPGDPTGPIEGTWYFVAE